MAYAELPEPRREQMERLLTVRQLEVVGLRADGFSWRRISRQLGIAVATVKDHHDAAMRRLNETEAA